MTTSTPTQSRGQARANPHERAARREKADALILALDAQLARLPAVSGNVTARALRSWPEENWAALADAAGVPMPSEQTRALVVNRYYQLAATEPEKPRGINAAAWFARQGFGGAS